jgi:uncharacterized protein YjgD (DUF1641 family)
MENKVNAIPWLETEAGVSVAKKLSDEKTLQALGNILDRLSFIDEATASLEKSSKQLPGLIAMGVDTTDTLVKQASSNGVSLDDRVKHLLPLLDRLTDPKTITQMENMLKFLDKAPGLISMATDTLDDTMERAVECDFELHKMFYFFAILNASICKAQKEELEKVSLFGMMRGFRDPDRQEAIGFIMKAMKHFGKGLRKFYGN